MKKLLVSLVLLFLFSINVTSAVAPTKPQVITTFTPINLPFRAVFLPIRPAPRQVYRAQPKILKPRPAIDYTKSVEGAKAMALALLGVQQFGCLNKLYIRESNWNPFDYNKKSGAYGIPQALPGSKMAWAGRDWRTNPLTQVRWGLHYIKLRYGTPCNALAHSYRVGWY